MRNAGSRHLASGSAEEELRRPVAWSPRRWLEDLPEHDARVAAVADASSPDVTPGRLRISRGDVLRLSEGADPLVVFVASVIWGFRRRGRRWRVSQALSYPVGRVGVSITRREAEVRIARLHAIAGEDPVRAFAER
jgi:hypothetical protein